MPILLSFLLQAYSFLLKIFHNIYIFILWLEIMSLILLGLINVKDDDLHRRNFNSDTNPIVITLVTAEQNVAWQSLEVLTSVFSQLHVILILYGMEMTERMMRGKTKRACSCSWVSKYSLRIQDRSNNERKGMRGQTFALTLSRAWELWENQWTLGFSKVGKRNVGLEYNMNSVTRDYRCLLQCMWHETIMTFWD